LRAPFFIASAGLLLCALMSIWLLGRRPAGDTEHAALADTTLSNDLANTGATGHAN
jgi:hypothetical protein